MASKSPANIRLNAREMEAWKHLGPDRIRELIAPRGKCIVCRTKKALSGTRNDWYCASCFASEVSDPRTWDELADENARLRERLKVLEAELKESDRAFEDAWNWIETVIESAPPEFREWLQERLPREEEPG